MTLQPGVTPFLAAQGEVYTLGQPLSLCFHTPGEPSNGAQYITGGDNSALWTPGCCGSVLPAHGQSSHEGLQLSLQKSPQLCSELLGQEAATHKHLPASCLPLKSVFFKPRDSHQTWPCSKVHAGSGGAGGGGKQRAIHNLCSTLESSCLANVKHCLGLFWALYFYEGCFELGEGCKGGFLITSTLKNKIPRRKNQKPSLVMWLMSHPIGASLEALRQEGHWRRALASLVIGDLLEELKPLWI